MQITNNNTPGISLYRDTITLFLDELEADSLVLISLYKATRGINWSNKWDLNDNISKWNGVTITDGRVSSLILDNNNLTGTIPQELHALTNLQSLNLEGNYLDSIPNLIYLPSITSIGISYNKLDFSSIIPNLISKNDNLRKVNLTYDPQKLLDTRDSLFTKLSASIQLSTNGKHQDNNYQWYKNGNKITDATNRTYLISNFSYADTGNYWVQITNDNAPDISLYRDTITLFLDQFEADSLALIDLYNSTDGSNWTNKWDLNDNVSKWYGVTITNGRVTSLALDSNNLTGAIPQEFQVLTNLQSLNLASNYIDNLPLLTYLLNTTSINISHNKLGFRSIIPNLLDKNNNLKEENFVYSPQRLLNTHDILIKKINDSIHLDVNDHYDDNKYQWYKDEIKITNATNRTYLINDFSYVDTGNYWVKITNPNLSTLTLCRNTITLFLDRLEADSLALVALYNATDGTKWKNKWDLNSTINEWNGVTITKGRVTELSLSNNYLNGYIPKELGSISGLTFFKLIQKLSKRNYTSRNWKS